MIIDPAIVKALNDTVFYVVFNLTKAVLFFMQRDSYLYWPFLLSTLVIVLLMPLLSGRRAAQSGISAGGGDFGDGGWKRFFNWRLWWNKSARADYRIYFANAVLFPLLATPLLLSDQQIAVHLNALIGRDTLNAAVNMEPAGLLARVLFTLLFFVAFDFGRFVAHSLMHDIPALWEFHKVHHSAQVLTLMTAYRVHPVELLLMAWIPALATSLVTWLFNLAGGGVTFYTFLGLHVAIWAFSLIDNLRHSPVWISYGTTVGRWMISPAHHQLHHSVETRHWGCNRGSNLALWDRLYGTLYVPGVEPETFRMGLGDGTEDKWHSVWRMYLVPFPACVRRIFEALRGKLMDRHPDSPSS